MKFEYLELTGYIGIYQGTLKNNIKITFGNNRITLIEGPNGSGKSTLFNAMTIYPDNNTCFIAGQQAEKKIVLNNRGTRYKIDIVHGVNDRGGRLTPKVFIKKEENGEWIECNPTGTVTSYKDYVESEFDMDPNFVALSALSTEDKGLVEKTPSERKKFVNVMIDYVDVYNNIHKVLTKRSTVFKSMINNILSKIDTIGEEESLIPILDNYSNQIAMMKNEREQYTDTISVNSAKIQVLDPDSSIQNLYRTIHVELEQVRNRIGECEKDEAFLLRKHELFTKNPNLFANADSTALQYLSVSDQIKEIEMRKESLNEELSSYLTEREDQYRAVQLKMKRIESLQSECNQDQLLSAIKHNKNIIQRCEKIFEDIHIKNAINISKDEYILGLNTMNSIKDMVYGIQSIHFNSDITTTIDLIRSNQSIVKLHEEKNAQYKDIDNRIENVSNEYSYYSGLADRAKILSGRPTKCKIDTCSFIIESLEAAKKKPEKKCKELEVLLSELRTEKLIIQKELESLAHCIEINNSLNIIFRNIENSRAILNKLPNSRVFLDRNLFLESVYSGSTFEEINDIYKYIDYANIFEEYRIAIDTLKDLEADYKIYQSKATSLEELTDELDNLNKKLDDIINIIETKRTAIDSSDRYLYLYKENKIKINELLSIQKNLDEDRKLEKELQNKLCTISDNIDQITESLRIIDDATISRNQLDNMINECEEKKNSVKHALVLLKDYKREMEEYEKSYVIVETIKKYSSPTKKGIQNLFIKVYMAQTLKLANDLISLFFDGRIKLLPYKIDADQFSIPYFSNYTGLTTDDVSSCSRSEKAMISLALSGALLKQASSMYDIFRIDEVEEGLDANNRLQFMKAVDNICNILNIEQFIMVSHSSELGLQNVDIIKMKDTVEINGNDGNVICRL